MSIGLGGARYDVLQLGLTLEAREDDTEGVLGEDTDTEGVLGGDMLGDVRGLEIVWEDQRGGR